MMRLLRRSTNWSIFWLFYKSENADEPGRVPSIETNGSQKVQRLKSTASGVRPPIPAFLSKSSLVLQHWTDHWYAGSMMLQNQRFSASTRTEPYFLASESFPWIWGVSKWLVESLPMFLLILLAFGTSLQQVMSPVRNLQKFSLLHRHAGPRHQNRRS